MATEKKTVKISAFSAELSHTVKQLGKNSQAAVDNAFLNLHQRADLAASGYYPKVLNVVSGDLSRATTGFRRNIGNQHVKRALIGLKNRMNYAIFQERGTKFIQPTGFMSTPLLAEANKAVDQVKKEIGF